MKGFQRSAFMRLRQGPVILVVIIDDNRTVLLDRVPFWWSVSAAHLQTNQSLTECQWR